MSSLGLGGWDVKLVHGGNLLAELSYVILGACMADVSDENLQTQYYKGSGGGRARCAMQTCYLSDSSTWWVLTIY